MTHSRRELSGWTQALRAAGSVAWFLGTLIGATAPAGASVYQATRPLAVSGTSPFAACTADELAYNPIVLDQEAEPFSSSTRTIRIISLARGFRINASTTAMAVGSESGRASTAA
jgi:hypothetical protein